MEASICACDYDPCDVWNERWPKARKAHKCCECGTAIPRGGRYQRIGHLFDGSWGISKTCQVCAAIRKDYCAPLGGLRETLQELLDVDYLVVPEDA